MKRLIICLTVALLAGCSPGSGKGLNANGRPIGEGATPGNEPTLANIQARVFTPICSVCHVGAAAPQGLRLDSANAYNNLVGVRSRQVGRLQRVNPFNPDLSYLVQKIEGTASVGDLMPLGGPRLSDEDIQLIRQWITDGAPNTPAAGNAAAAVSSVRVDASSLSIEFSVEIEPGSANAGTVSLQRVGDSEPVAYRVLAHPLNPRAVLVEWQPAGDAADYRLSLNADPALSLTGSAGQAIAPFDMEFRP